MVSCVVWESPKRDRSHIHTTQVIRFVLYELFSSIIVEDLVRLEEVVIKVSILKKIKKDRSFIG